MLKYLKAKIITAVTFSAVMCVGVQAWAFEGTQSFKTVSLGTCDATAIITPDSAFATVITLNGSYGSVATSEATEVKDITELSRANIAEYCNVLDATVTVTGPSSSSYSEAEHIGFIIEGYATGEAEAGTAPVFTRWEVAVTGRTNTQLIATKSETVSDTSAPTITLSDAPTTVNNIDPFTVTATFTEEVTGFDNLKKDVTVTNGAATDIRMVSATVYTLIVKPTGAGDVEITVPAAAAIDTAGNANTVSNTLEVRNTIVEDTQKAITGFMLGRANNLASNQPGLTRFLMGDDCGSFDANATEGNASIDGCVSRGNTWAEITGSWSGGSSYTLGSFGAHSFVNPNLIVGGMVQFDYADDDTNKISGRGWMVGPYFAAKHGTQPLFFEGRLLYGQTENEITPLGTYTDSFETERWLAQLRATGQYKVQNTTLIPLLDFTSTDDSQQTYTDTLGNTIPSQTVGIMQVSAGMDLRKPLPVQTGALDLTGGLSAIYASTNGGAAQQDFEGGRGRAHLGLNYDMVTGATMHVGTFYDGLLSDYEAYGAKIGFDLKF